MERPSLSPRARLVVGLCALTLAGSACIELGGGLENTAQRSPRPQRTRTNEDILVLGDSLTVGARNAGGLADKLTDDGWVPEVVAEEGKTTPWATEIVSSRERVPRVVLVALGTNPSPVLRDFAREVEELIDALRDRGARRIVWIPPRASDPERYLERVTVLRDAAARGRMLVSDWDSFASDHHEWFHTDGIHLSVEGYVALAEHEREVLSAL